MGRINVGRVLLGGLLAGLVFNVFEALVGRLFILQLMTDALAAIGRAAPEAPMWMAYYVILGFLWGIFGVWIYAAIRPRFGPGPRTAVIAGLVLWLAWPVFLGLGQGPLGIFPAGFYYRFVVYGLVEHVTMLLAGAWLYREA